MGRKWNPCSIVNQGTEEEVTNIKPMYLLLMLLKTWGHSVKTLPSKIILLKSDGQQTAWTEITVIQSRTCYREDKKQKCGVCKPLQWHNMSWMNRKVRSENLQCDQGLMVHGMSLIDGTDTSPLWRRMHNMHLAPKFNKTRGCRHILLLTEHVMIMCHVLSVFLLSPMLEPHLSKPRCLW